MQAEQLRLFGRTVREHRVARRLSLFDLASAMGWQGTSPLLAIEQGKRLPRTETIERLAECLSLGYEELIYLQGLAGYRTATELPPLGQIGAVLEGLRRSFPPEQLMFPVYLMDYRFRLWLANGAALIYLGDERLMQALIDERWELFRIIFDSRISVNDIGTNQDQVRREQLYRFKARNALRRHEAFYRAYPAQLEPYLLPEDYAAFCHEWERVASGGLSVPFKTINHTVVDGISMDFILEEQPLPQLADLFFLVTYYPAPTADNMERCQRFFAPQRALLERWYAPTRLELPG